MPILGDVLQILFEQELLGQVIRNVFGYVVSVADPAATMEDVADRMIIEIGDVQLTFQNNAVNAVLCTAKNLDNPDEFQEVAWVGSGGHASDGPVLPSYVAAGFKLLRGDVDTRNGSKRVAGIGEDVVSNNDWDGSVGPAVLTYVDALAATIFITPSTMEIMPVIIGRDPITGQPDTGRIAPVIEAQANPQITTQNSRKAGRGE